METGERNLVELPVVYYKRTSIHKSDIDDEKEKKKVSGNFDYASNEEYGPLIRTLMEKTYKNLITVGTAVNDPEEVLKNLAQESYNKEQLILGKKIKYTWSQGCLSEKDAETIKALVFSAAYGNNKNGKAQNKDINEQLTILEMFLDKNFYDDLNKIIMDKDGGNSFTVSVLNIAINDILLAYLSEKDRDGSLLKDVLRQRGLDKKGNGKNMRGLYVKGNAKSKKKLEELIKNDVEEYINEDAKSTAEALIKSFSESFFMSDEDKKEKGKNKAITINAKKVRLINKSDNNVADRKDMEKNKIMPTKKSYYFTADFIGIDELLNNLPFKQQSSYNISLTKNIKAFLMAALDNVVSLYLKNNKTVNDYYNDTVRDKIEQGLDDQKIQEHLKNTIKNMIDLQSMLQNFLEDATKDVTEKTINTIKNRLQSHIKKHENDLKHKDDIAKGNEILRLFDEKDKSQLLNNIRGDLDAKKYIEKLVNSSTNGYKASIKGSLVELLVGSILNISRSATINGSNTNAGYQSIADIIINVSDEANNKTDIGIQIKAYSSNTFTLYDDTKIHLDNNHMLQKYYGKNDDNFSSGYGGALGLEYLSLNAQTGQKIGFQFDETKLLELSKLYISYFLRIQDFLEESGLQNNFFILKSYVIPTSVLIGYILQQYKNINRSLFDVKYKQPKIDKTETLDEEIDWYDNGKYGPRLVLNENMLKKLSKQYIQFNGIGVSLNKLIN